MDENDQTPPHEKNEPADVAEPLSKGEPLTLEKSIERMYERYGRTFEALSK